MVQAENQSGGTHGLEKGPHETLYLVWTRQARGQERGELLVSLRASVLLSPVAALF